jgi:hypothetical protein
MEVFKNPAGNKMHYLGGLVVLQITISVVLIAFSINVKRQMDYIIDTVPQAHQIIRVNAYPFSQDFANHLVQSATTTEYLPGVIHPSTSISDETGKYSFILTKSNFFEFLRIPIIHGRVFDSIPSTIKQVVVNKSFVKSRNIEENPIGFQFYTNLREHRIVGVCEDFTTLNAMKRVPPSVYIFEPDIRWGFYIRFQGSLENKIAEINELFEKYKGDGERTSLQTSTLADYYINLNPEVKRLRIMVEFFALISVFLSAMGLVRLVVVHGRAPPQRDCIAQSARRHYGKNTTIALQNLLYLVCYCHNNRLANRLLYQPTLVGRFCVSH